jgi:hypothetical protein
MGDSLGSGVGFTAPRPGRREAAEFFGFAVDQTEFEVGESDDPVAGFSLGDADRLADQGFADEHQVATPSDLAVRSHPAHGVVRGIDRIFDTAGIGSQAALPDLGRRKPAIRSAISASILCGMFNGACERSTGPPNGSHAYRAAHL